MASRPEDVAVERRRELLPPPEPPPLTRDVSPDGVVMVTSRGMERDPVTTPFRVIKGGLPP